MKNKELLRKTKIYMQIKDRNLNKARKNEIIFENITYIEIVSCRLYNLSVRKYLFLLNQYKYMIDSLL